ncbi:MAG: isocitrate dehydrogenase [Pseudonocardia sp.]|nr:isocitrate dehydrogenase [Pseudonocardia sp.]
MDGNAELVGFCEALERVVVETVESGAMTKDLALLIGPDAPYQSTEEFLATLGENLRNAVAAAPAG